VTSCMDDANWAVTQLPPTSSYRNQVLHLGVVFRMIVLIKFHQYGLSGFRDVWVKIYRFPLLWPLAYTTACATVQLSRVISRNMGVGNHSNIKSDLQGHSRSLVGHIRFPISLPLQLCILYQFRDIVSYFLKFNVS